jgi:predicted dehydrogenase
MTSRRAALTILPAAAIRSSAANSAPAVGVIGFGNRGSYLGRLVQDSGRARLAAAADLFDASLEKAKQLSPSVAVYKDFHGLLASNLDAVIIATPVFLHAGHLEAAVKSGKHIYIEKPAAASVADCKRMLRLVDSAPRTQNISFGFQRRYGAVYQKAKRAHDNGAIGRIRWAQVHFVKSSSARKTGTIPRPTSLVDRVKQWYLWRDLCGDLIVENNVHVLDVMNWFAGAHPMKAIGAGGRTIPGPGDVRDFNHVTYTYPGGVQGILTGTTAATPGFRAVFEQFHGPDGAIEVSENHWKLLRGLKEEDGEKAPRNPSSDSIAAFLDRISSGKPENTGARGIESTLTAILGRMAMDAGHEVTWEQMMADG